MTSGSARKIFVNLAVQDRGREALAAKRATASEHFVLTPGDERMPVSLK